MFDRHRIWREVAHIYEHLEANPRDGYVVVCEVYIQGRAPLLVGVVETRRDPDYEWVKLNAGDADGGYVFVRESLIARVEVGYRAMAADESERFATGFRVEEAADGD